MVKQQPEGGVIRRDHGKAADYAREDAS